MTDHYFRFPDAATALAELTQSLDDIEVDGDPQTAGPGWAAVWDVPIQIITVVGGVEQIAPAPGYHVNVRLGDDMGSAADVLSASRYRTDPAAPQRVWAS